MPEISHAILNKIQEYKRYLYRKFTEPGDSEPDAVNKVAIHIGIVNQLREVLRLTEEGYTDDQIMAEFSRWEVLG